MSWNWPTVTQILEKEIEKLKITIKEGCSDDADPITRFKYETNVKYLKEMEGELEIVKYYLKEYSI